MRGRSDQHSHKETQTYSVRPILGWPTQTKETGGTAGEDSRDSKPDRASESINLRKKQAIKETNKKSNRRKDRQQEKVSAGWVLYIFSRWFSLSLLLTLSFFLSFLAYLTRKASAVIKEVPCLVCFFRSLVPFPLLLLLLLLLLTLSCFLSLLT